MNYYRKILKTLSEIKTLHPTYELGKHLATAFDGHDMWGISDKDFLTVIVDYKDKFEADVNRRIDSEDIAKVIKEGMKLHSSWLLEDDDI